MGGVRGTQTPLYDLKECQDLLLAFFVGPRVLSGTRIGGNGSYKLPGASSTLQDPGEKPKSCILEPYILYN